MPRPKSFDASSVEGIIDQRNFRGRVQYQIACADEIPQWMYVDDLVHHRSIAALIESFNANSCIDTAATVSPKATKRGRKSRAASSIEEKVEEVKEEKKSRSRSRVRSTTIEEKISTPPRRYSRSKKAESTTKIQSSGKRGRPKKQTTERSTENDEVDDRQLSMAEELKQPIDYFASHFQPAQDEKSDSITAATKVSETSIVYQAAAKRSEERHRHGRLINHLRGQSILFGFILLFAFAYFSILDHSSVADRTALAGFLPSIIPAALWNFLQSIMQTSISLSDIIAVPLFILVSQLLDGRRGIYEQRVLHCAVLFFTLSFYRYLVEGSALTLNPLAPPVFHCITTAIASFHTVFLIRNVTSNKLTVARFLYSSLSATVAIIVLYHQYTKASSSALMHHHIFTLLAASSFDAILSFSFIVIAYSRALAKSFQIASGLLMAIGSIIYGIILFHHKSGLQFSESWCAATILCGLDFLWMLDSWTHENNKKKQKEVHA